METILLPEGRVHKHWRPHNTDIIWKKWKFSKVVETLYIEGVHADHKTTTTMFG